MSDEEFEFHHGLNVRMRAMNSMFHSNAGWLRLEKTSGEHLIQLPCPQLWKISKEETALTLGTAQKCSWCSDGTTCFLACTHGLLSQPPLHLSLQVFVGIGGITPMSLLFSRLNGPTSLSLSSQDVPVLSSPW